MYSVKGYAPAPDAVQAHHIRYYMMSEQTITTLSTQPFSAAAYKPYGNAIGADEEASFVLANMGRAKRYNFLSDVENLRPDSAKLNLCVFRCSVIKLPLQVELLEKHQHSTQVFLPMSKTSKYLAIVCLGGNEPDLSTLSAFIVEGAQGISYHPGVWHYPMAALEEEIDFACLVWEDQTKEDCEVFKFSQSITVG
jgi:ureidoglycolate lyase